MTYLLPSSKLSGMRQPCSLTIFGGDFVHAFLSATRAIPHPCVFNFNFIFAEGPLYYQFLPKKIHFQKVFHTHTRVADCAWCCKIAARSSPSEISIFLCSALNACILNVL